MKNVLGIDIGGTNLRGAVVSERGEISDRYKTTSGANIGIETLVTNLENFLSHYKNHNLDAIGIGIPGIIDNKTGVVTQAPNIKNSKNFPIKKTLSKITDLPITIENDASSAALGEFWMGAGKDTNSMAIMTIGTGLGGGLIIDGKLWTGVNGMAGEIGHMTINPDGPLCNCGNYGCLESYVSAEAIRRIVKENTTLSSEFKNINKQDVPEKLMELALNENQQAINIWEEFGVNLGIGIASLVNVLNMEVVVIGGGLSNAWNLFIESTKSEVIKRGLTGPVDNLKIEKAKLGDDAGIMGAAYLALL